MTQQTIKPTQDDHRIAKLAAVAIILSMIEFFFPSPITGVKPGIANIITLYALISFGFYTAFWVSIIRIFISGILLGSFLSPTFFLSFLGGISSLLILFLLKNLYGKFFGVISLSLWASFAHIMGQFILVRLWIVPDDGIYTLLPFFLLSALIFGVINGFITFLLLKQKK